MNIYLDMDGVLTDFNAGMCKAHGRELPYNYRGGLKWDYFTEWNMTAEEFYEPASEPFFWAKLPWMPDGKSILSSVEDALEYYAHPDMKIYIATTPIPSSVSAQGCAASQLGKLAWVMNNLPEYADRTIALHDKSILASVGSILVDDKLDNVREFFRKGGRSVLVPRAWSNGWAPSAVPMSIPSYVYSEVVRQLNGC